MANALKNFNVIITGGTGSLGREITAEFIKYGATVYTNYRTAQKFEDLKKFVPDAKNLAGFEADLTVESQVKDFFRKFEADFKRLDVFLHIMGGFWMGGGGLGGGGLGGGGFGGFSGGGGGFGGGGASGGW